MANRRQVKKNINGLLGDVIEEYYNELINNGGKNEDKIEAIVDECADLANELISKINSAKKLKSRAEVKKLFAEVKDTLGDKVIAHIKQLDKL